MNSMALNLFLNWVKFTSVDLNRAARPDQRQPRRQQRLTFSIKRRGWRKVKSCWWHLNDPWYVFLELWGPSQVSAVQAVLRVDQICYPQVLLAFSSDVFGVAPSAFTAIVIECAPTSAHTLRTMETDSNSCQAPQTFVSLVTFIVLFFFFALAKIQCRENDAFYPALQLDSRRRFAAVKSWCTLQHVCLLNRSCMSSIR